MRFVSFFNRHRPFQQLSLLLLILLFSALEVLLCVLMGFDGDLVVSRVGCEPSGPGFNTCPLQTIIQENLPLLNLNGNSGSAHKKIIQERKLSSAVLLL